MSISSSSLFHLTPWHALSHWGVHRNLWKPCCITELCLPFKLYVTADPRLLAEEQPLPEALRCTSLFMRVLCFLALGRTDLDDLWKLLQSEQAFETIRSRLCSILASIITTVSYLTLRELNTALTYSHQGERHSRSRWCFHHYGLSCVILWLYVTRSSLFSLYIAYARHDCDDDIWLEHDTLATHWSPLDSRGKGHSRHPACTDWPKYDQQLKPGGYFVLSYLFSIVSPMFFVALFLHCFIFGQLLYHLRLSLVPYALHSSDVDSRLFLSKYNLPRHHCILDGHIRRRHWDNIDGNYLEVCDKPQSR
jgi:hypothetical protein